MKENEKTCENVEGMGLSFYALLYADDTLLVTAAGHSMEVLLLAVERVSEVFGLCLNREMCKDFNETDT